MIFEGTITYLTIDDNGDDKAIKERYIIENAEMFSDAESMLYDLQKGRDMDVVAIKRSAIKEIANKRNFAEEKVWIAEIADTFTDEDGEEKLIVYKIALYAKNFDGAKNFMGEYMTQGYSMDLVSLKMTKFVDVL